MQRPVRASYADRVFTNLSYAADSDKLDRLLGMVETQSVAISVQASRLGTLEAQQLQPQYQWADAEPEPDASESESNVQIFRMSRMH